MPISALPTPPSRSDSPQDFSDRADALLGALPGFVTEANALQSDVNAKESSASSHATVATDKAAEAQGYATTATTKAGEAAASAVAAAAAASNAEIAFDSFDDKYLGSKASDPATDNDGNPLLTGALYWNTSVGAVRVWNGSAWLSMAADASIVDFQQAGTGAVVRTAQDKMRELVSVKDFGADPTGVADSSPAVQAALNAGGGGLFFPPGVYRMATQVRLPNYTFYDDQAGRTVYGHGAQIVVETTVPLFTNDQIAEPTGYTSKWKFKDLSFFSSTANSKLFDMDRIYNSIFSHCVFEGIASVFYSRVDRSGDPNYPDGYIQSAYINNNHFSQCAKCIDAKRAFNLAVSHNFFESCGVSVAVDGGHNPACNMIRITDNVMEGGSGTPIILGGVFGGVIQGNYFEENAGATTCEIKLDVSGASPHRGLAIIGNQFQPAPAQAADTNWFCIRLANTVPDGRGPSILSNTTSGPRLVYGADATSLVTGNYEGVGTKVLDSFPVPQQTNVEIGGLSLGFVNNRATAFNGTDTWKVIKIDNIVRDAVYEVDGFLNLYNISGTLVGRTLVSFKFWVQIDGQSVYTAGLLGVANIEDLTGARDSSGNPMYSSYWGTVTPTFAFSGSTLTISFNAFTDYSMLGPGVVHSLGPNLAIRAMKGDPNFTRVQISMP